MRDIKFRAWYKPKRKMYSKSLESINFETKVLGIYTISDGYQQLRMSDFEIMQYTGLKDSNGKEIYEGDIVKVNRLSFESSAPLPENLTVTYYAGMFQFFRGNEPLMGLHLSYLEDGEVVGNIYEKQ